jgi:hypothetical protein
MTEESKNLRRTEVVKKEKARFLGRAFATVNVG